MLRALKELVHTLVPSPILTRILSAYHFMLASLAAVVYGFPSRFLFVVGVTGTKGKTTVTEMVNIILEEAGHTTALINSIHFKIGEKSEPNLTRMSMPGRFFIQKFLSDAVRAQCTAAVLEMTSEGARQHRHRFIDLNALIFTNFAPEHIESHGSIEAYANTKFEIGKELARSNKRPRFIVANAEDKEATRYLSLPVEYALPFLLAAENASADEHGGSFMIDGTRVTISLPGAFSLRNALSAAMLARALGIAPAVIARALEKLKKVPGRAERIEAGPAFAKASAGKQSFTVVVDYAHTPDSLAALYDAYRNVKKICVVSATGGGRDTWKRPVMGHIAEEQCETVILTNEDPYDEDPQQIAEDIARGMSKRPEIIMDRREAISRALEIALSMSKGIPRQARDPSNQNGIAVLITGKGTDPSICGPRGTKIPWNDGQVAREELEALLKKGTV
ncbi:UDP-N-acetylmuramyl-tripeptide synthetase [Candidatus Kaiserbacteria bacterium]|nr:UDP-N-acetylmuramyl-tripeptide synthetase [Candidatus Kaiserbacteria bacterium]